MFGSITRLSNRELPRMTSIATPAVRVQCGPAQLAFGLCVFPAVGAVAARWSVPHQTKQSSGAITIQKGDMSQAQKSEAHALVPGPTAAWSEI